MVAPNFETEVSLTVIAQPGAGLRATTTGLASVANASVSSLEDTLSTANASLKPMFGNEDQVRTQAAALSKDIEFGLSGGLSINSTGKGVPNCLLRDSNNSIAAANAQS